MSHEQTRNKKIEQILFLGPSELYAILDALTTSEREALRSYGLKTVQQLIGLLPDVGALIGRSPREAAELLKEQARRRAEPSAQDDHTTSRDFSGDAESEIESDEDPATADR